MDDLKLEGLILPDCKCFHKNAITMNASIDNLSNINLRNSMISYSGIGICEAAKDYFVGCLIADFMIWLLPPAKQGYDPLSNYKEELEGIYNRLKPIIMQRLDYADGIMDSEIWNRNKK